MTSPCITLDGCNDVFEPMVRVHRDTFVNEFVNLLPFEPFHVRIHVLIQSRDALSAVLFGLSFQVDLRGRYQLLVSDCPCLFLSHVLNGMLGEGIAHIADWRFAIGRDRVRIRHVAITRRLDNLNGRLLHIVFEVVASGLKVNPTEVVD